MQNPESSDLTRMHHFLGGQAISTTATRFCVWAADHRQISVRLVDQDRTVPMAAVGGGYHLAEIEGVEVGNRYYFRLSSGLDRPDPASRCQPDGVHGPSQVVSRMFPWTDQHWSGIPHREMVIYELHVGTFTGTGTFSAAIDRLDELVELGITAIELMPVAETSGRWNWGYDGVYWFAPNHNYGKPDDLKRLVDAAHQKGLAVILDVVYNHFGPEGNYLGDFGPYLSSKHQTPWGAAPNFDDPEHGRNVQGFCIANAVHWFDEYHFDALRVDAIHCMKDDNEPHVVAEISEAARVWSAETDQPAMLIAESNVYDSDLLVPVRDGGLGFSAEWCDDFLHSLFAVVRPDQKLCHRDYIPGRDLEQTLRLGYVFSGSMRSPSKRRRPDQRVATDRLIYSIQNHDFIGNHPVGSRLHQLTSPAAQQAAAALLILSPAIPMLFMGEEFACENPFRFFVDFGDDNLKHAVNAGRRREYPQHDWASGRLPTDHRCFDESRIGSIDQGDRRMWCWYQSLISLRKEWQASGLLSDANLTVETDAEQGVFCLRYQATAGSALVAVRLNSDADRDNDYPIACLASIVLNSRRSKGDVSALRTNHAIISIASGSGD